MFDFFLSECRPGWFDTLTILMVIFCVNSLLFDLGSLLLDHSFYLLTDENLDDTDEEEEEGAAAEAEPSEPKPKVMS